MFPWEHYDECSHGNTRRVAVQSLAFYNGPEPQRAPHLIPDGLIKNIARTGALLAKAVE
jgi:hypothetical protein